MRLGLSLPFAFLILFAALSAASAQDFNYDAYEPRTLAEIIKKYDSPDLHKRSLKDVSAVFGYDFPSRVEVVYTGTVRKLSGQRKEHVENWAKTRGLPSEIAGLFESELLFVENSVEHWLPVQKQVIPYFEKEVKKGEKIFLYVVAAGGVKIEGKWEWLILVNEFEVMENSPPKKPLR